VYRNASPTLKSIYPVPGSSRQLPRLSQRCKGTGPFPFTLKSLYQRYPLFDDGTDKERERVKRGDIGVVKAFQIVKCGLQLSAPRRADKHLPTGAGAGAGKATIHPPRFRPEDAAELKAAIALESR